MRKLPIGNDQPIRWAVTVSGKPFNLEGQDVHVYVVNSRGEIPLRSLKVKGAEVSGVFEGRYQTRLGEHSLILRVNEGRPEMKTASVANVFELVKWSADAGGSDEGDVIITPVILESELSIGGVSYDDTELREAIEDLEQKKVNKTDLATINGQRIDEGGNIEIEGSAESLVFEAIKGETSYDEIKEAFETNKVVYCYWEYRVYMLTKLEAGAAYFAVVHGNYYYRLVCYPGTPSKSWRTTSENFQHSLSTLDNGNVQVTIAGKSAEVATPQYVENAIASAITNVLNEEV